MSELLGATVTGSAERRIRELAAAAHPDEGCGVMLGRWTAAGAAVVEVTSGRNLNRERSRDRYLLDPADIVRADHRAREQGLDIVGYWHSHPDHPAWPSQFDTDHAWVDYVYVIVNSTAAGTGDLNAFALSGEGEPFAQLTLTITGG